MKSKAEFQIIYEVKDRRPCDFPRYFLSKKSFQSKYLDIINSTKSREVAGGFLNTKLNANPQEKWPHC